MTFSKEFLDITPKAQYIKEKIVKLNLIKIRKSCSVKDTGRRMKIQRKYLQITHRMKGM